MKLKQIRNPGGGYFWENDKKELCGCMIGQIVLALHPEIKTSIQVTEKKLMLDAVRIHSKVIAGFSDGICNILSIPRKKYEQECEILKDKFPTLNLEFPAHDSYKLMEGPIYETKTSL